MPMSRKHSERISSIRLGASTLVLVGLVLLSHVGTASAQIYTWRDANGRLVLSNKRPADDLSIQTVTVTESPETHVTALESDASATDPTADRAREYYDLIATHAKLNGIRPSLVRAVIQVESGFNPMATSQKGAMGLMQLMPATARQFGVRNPYNAAENLQGGVAYLRHLLNRYGENEQLALAAYNAGPGAVDRYGQQVPPYRETRGYVIKVNKIAGPIVDGEARLVPRPTHVYKVIDIINGRPVARYTDRSPDSSN
jgi:soluble lytic murein transglycosylase-like protein